MKGLLSFLLIVSALFSHAQTDTLFFRHPDSLKSFVYYPLETPQDITDGEVLSTHLNSSVIAEQYYLIKGKKYGSYKAFDTEGNLRIFTVYSNDVINGEYSFYNERGELSIKGNYRMGDKHGYWSYIEEGCYGRYLNDYRQGKWKCFGYGELLSRVFYDHGRLLNSKAEVGEAENTPKSKTKEPKKPVNPAVQANMYMNPRFRSNLYVGQNVFILEYKAKSMDSKVSGRIAEIVSKGDFDGRGMKVKLEDGKEGRVVEFIDLPKSD